MAGMWQKTLFYLGLVDEDDVEEVVEDEAPSRARRQPASRPNTRATSQSRSTTGQRNSGQVPGRRVEPPLTARRRVVSDAAASAATGEVPRVRTVTESDLESEVIVARSYSDAQALADHIRANIPVVLDLRKVEPAMARRLVDFASGLTYALGGSMRKVNSGVVLVTPSNVNISRDERRRLVELGYSASSESV